jgi:Transposase DDE domain
MSATSFYDRFTQTFNPEPFEQMARKTGWQKRKGKIIPVEFINSLSLGQLSASRPTLSSQSQSLSQAVTRQGIDQRFTPQAVEFVKAAFAHITGEVLDWSPTHPQAEQLRAHFTALSLLDSTSFDCAENLKELFPSCGGDGSAANVKVLLRYELISGRLEPLGIMAGKRSDQGQALGACEHLHKGQMELRDKGFFDSKAWAAAEQREAYLLMPLPHGVTLWTLGPEGAKEQPLDLAAELRATEQQRMEWSKIYTGTKGHRAGPLRLVAFRRSPESSARYRQGLRESMRTKGRIPSAKALELAGWVLLVTNAPAQKLPSAAMSYLYRVRWQVELIFRQTKSVLRLDKSKSGDPDRIQCEIWGRLISAVLLFWWHAHASAECWLRHQREISFEKLIRIIQHWGLNLMRAFLKGPRELLDELRTVWKQVMCNGRKEQQKSRATSWENLVNFWLNPKTNTAS